MIKAYTSGSAYGTLREIELGTLEEGKLADIVVLEQKFFEILAEDIQNTGVELTIADGRLQGSSTSIIEKNRRAPVLFLSMNY